MGCSDVAKKGAWVKSNNSFLRIFKSKAFVGDKLWSLRFRIDQLWYCQSARCCHDASCDDVHGVDLRNSMLWSRIMFTVVGKNIQMQTRVLWRAAKDSLFAGQKTTRKNSKEGRASSRLSHSLHWLGATGKHDYKFLDLQSLVPCLTTNGPPGSSSPSIMLP